MFRQNFGIYIDKSLEKIHGPGTYGGVMHEQSFGAEMSIHELAVRLGKTTSVLILDIDNRDNKHKRWN